MKTNTLLIKRSIGVLILPCALFLIPSLMTAQEVVIEGGPAKIQLSDQDGELERPVPGPAVAIPERTAITTESASGNMIVETIPGSDVYVNVPTSQSETLDIIESTEPAGDPQLEQLNVEKMKKLTAYADSLGIAEASTSAQVTWETDELFVRDEALVAPAVEPTLREFADYLKLAPWDDMTLTFFYDPTTQQSQAARDKAQAMVDFLTEEMEVTEFDYTIAEPVSLDETSEALVNEPVIEITMR